MLRLPFVNDILETIGGRMTVFLQVRNIVRAALNIHFARIPIAVFRLALRPPMRPDAELRVAKPFRRLIIRERIPVRLELSLRNLEMKIIRDTRMPGAPQLRILKNEHTIK